MSGIAGFLLALAGMAWYLPDLLRATAAVLDWMQPPLVTHVSDRFGLEVPAGCLPYLFFLFVGLSFLCVILLGLWGTAAVATVVGFRVLWVRQRQVPGSDVAAEAVTPVLRGPNGLS